MPKETKPKLRPENDCSLLIPDEKGIIHLEEVEDPNFDMKYYSYTERDVKQTEICIRNSFEYRELIYFFKAYLDVNHCSFYPEYGALNGLTIELHHAPFTLFDITDAVIAKSMKEKGYWERFLVVEEVVRLHYQFKVGLTPLNPTAHKLVHAGKIKVHPKIVIGFWKPFFTEYSAYLNDDAFNKYKTALELESNVKNPEFPAILEYKPFKLQTPYKVIDTNFVDKLCIDSKFKKLEKLSA